MASDAYRRKEKVKRLGERKLFKRRWGNARVSLASKSEVMFFLFFATTVPVKPGEFTI